METTFEFLNCRENYHTNVECAIQVAGPKGLGLMHSFGDLGRLWSHLIRVFRLGISLSQGQAQRCFLLLVLELQYLFSCSIGYILRIMLLLFQGVPASSGKPQKILVSAVSSISEVRSDEWDACNLDSTGPKKFNPFLTHGFLSSLEESGSAVKFSCYRFSTVPKLNF